MVSTSTRAVAALTVAGLIALAAPSGAADQELGDRARPPGAPSVDCESFEAVAHRGFHPWWFDENSKRAFQSAAARGLPIELDVRADAEGVLWVFHDPDTERATGQVGVIAEMTTKAVSELRYRKIGDPLVRFDEAMTIFVWKPGLPVYIEPKTSAAAYAVAKQIVEADRTENTWVTAYTSEVHQSHPEIRLMDKVRDGDAPAPRALGGTGVDVVALPADQLTADTVAAYHAVGVEVQGQQSNWSAEWLAALEARADGQLTDDPIRLQRFCSELP